MQFNGAEKQKVRLYGKKNKNIDMFDLVTYRQRNIYHHAYAYAGEHIVMNNKKRMRNLSIVLYFHSCEVHISNIHER